MPPASSSARGAATDNYDLGLRQYKKGDWADAARSFDRAISLGYKDALAYETKAKAYLKQYDVEISAYQRTRAGPDGQVIFEQAHRAAKTAVEKFGKERWQSLYLLVDVIYRKSRYSAAQKYLTMITEHPSFRRATDAQRELIGGWQRRIAKDLRYNHQRVKGHAESEAVQADLHREAEYRRTLNFEHILTADIFLRIVELGRDTDPGLAVRMSGVCRRWREVLVNQPGLWQRLILGRGPYLALKVKTLLERCGRSGLKELRITPGFDTNRIDEVAKAIEPAANGIERLAVCITGPDRFLVHFRGRMASLKILEVSMPGSPGRNWTYTPSTTPTLDFGLLPIHSSPLEELTINTRPSDTSWSSEWLRPVRPFDIDPPFNHFRHLRVLRLQSLIFDSNVEMMSIANVINFLKHAPKMREVDIDGLEWPNPRWAASLPQPASSVLLEGLHSWSENALCRLHISHGPIAFNYINAPNLTQLELRNFAPPGANGVTPFLRSPGLIDALPRLRSLGLSKCSVDDALLSVLQDMESLEFLDLSYCNLSASFLDGLASGALADPPLLPNLVAISLAGNTELRASIVREFVNSRLPLCDRIPTSTASLLAPAKKKGGGMFAPSSRQSSQAQTQPRPASTAPKLGRPSTSAASSHVPASGDNTPVPPATPMSPARLRWLNVDLCENIEEQLYPALEKRIPFVSHWMGTVDDDRIRGKGRWDWRLDLSVACRMKVRPGPDEAKCDVRADGTGGYHVHHVCGREYVEHDPTDPSQSQRGWEWTSQASQESKGKKGGARVGGGRGTGSGIGGAGEERRKRLRAMQEE